MVANRQFDTHNTVKIEPMRLEDIEDVVKLDTICFPTPWSESAYITELSNKSAYYIVARDDKRIVGFAGEWVIADEAHITTIGVHPEYRGKRIGERILVNMLEKAILLGAKRATLEVRKSNVTAQRLYRKYNFDVVAIRKQYYTNNNEDAYVMWLNDMTCPAFLNSLKIYKEQLEALD